MGERELIKEALEKAIVKKFLWGMRYPSQPSEEIIRREKMKERVKQEESSKRFGLKLTIPYGTTAKTEKLGIVGYTLKNEPIIHIRCPREDCGRIIEVKGTLVCPHCHRLLVVKSINFAPWMKDRETKELGETKEAETPTS